METPTIAPKEIAAKTPARGVRGGGRPQARRAQKSRYGVQMEEKQNLKKVFGIREEQLRKYYAQAKRSPEETGRELISLLEQRLDNAIYRAGFAPTRAAARQMSTHRLFAINGRAVDVPSIRLRSGDTISVREGKRGKALFSNFEKRMQNVHTPGWIVVDDQNYAFKVTSKPTLEEANLGVDVQAIVEYFAR